MSLKSFSRKVISDLRGAWTSLNNTEGSPERASDAQNIQYSPRWVRTRDGFVSKLTVVGAVTSLFNWITSGVNRLIFMEGLTIKLWDFSAAPVNLFTAASGFAFIAAEAAQQVYFAIYDANAAGTSQARIVNLNLVGTPADKAFAGPWTSSPTITDPGPGQVTAGAKRFGYIVETRTGYTGRPSPISGNIFSPVTFTVPAGGRQLQANMTVASIPIEAVYIHPIMTRSDNLAKWYFVPESTIAVPGGATAWPVSWTINVSDDDLAARGASADKYLNYLSQDSGGNGPFNPNFVCAYGRRMVYGAGHKVYVSEINDYQAITEDLNTIESPGRKYIISAFVLRGVLYLVGENWTYSIVDNGDSPRLWGTPQEVSAGIGSSASNGVTAATGGDWAWVASQAGLYLFTGQYQDRPFSYLQSDLWASINWAQASKIRVVDDWVNRRVHVMAPLGASTNSNDIFVWDYTRGMTPEDCDFSRNQVNSLQGTTWATMGMVKSPTSSRSNLWLGPFAPNAAIVGQNPGTKTDLGLYIPAVWESGNVLTDGEQASKLLNFLAYWFYIQGSGSAVVKVYSKGRTGAKVNTLATIALSATGLKEIRRKSHIKSENITIQVVGGSLAAGDWFELSTIDVAYRDWLDER